MENSVNLKEVKNRINLIRKIHYGVFVFFLIGVGVIIFYKELAIYGAAYISFVGLIQAGNKGRCPLTVEERNARKQIGDTSEEKFIEGIFKRHMNMSVSPYVIRAILLFGLGLASYTVVIYIISVF